MLSLHFFRAGDHGRAWDYAREAAERARMQGAHADAALLLRRALDAAKGAAAEPDAVADAWVALGEAQARSGSRTRRRRPTAAPAGSRPATRSAPARCCSARRSSPTAPAARRRRCAAGCAPSGRSPASPATRPPAAARGCSPRSR